MLKKLRQKKAKELAQVMWIVNNGAGFEVRRRPAPEPTHWARLLRTVTRGVPSTPCRCPVLTKEPGGPHKYSVSGPHCYAAARNQELMASEVSERGQDVRLSPVVWRREEKCQDLEIFEFLFFRLNIYLKSVVFIMKCSLWSQNQDNAWQENNKSSWLKTMQLGFFILLELCWRELVIIEN